ncbi:MAG: HD domain-containing protein [Sphingobacteriales bacterium]|nr:HD domain-containing protein [Sphingobacteriales bacterium]
MKNLKNIIDEIFELYQNFGDEDYIGEPVSQIEHMLQAATLASQYSNDDEVILAAFFHDIGHLVDLHHGKEKMGAFGVVSHEDIGAQFLLKNGFSDRIAKLVKSHVAAKRYLTYKYPEYLQKLSDASIATLNFQGGPMNEQEAVKFESDPDKELMILFRKWDDEAKSLDMDVIDFEMIKQKAHHHLQKRNWCF